MARNAKQSRPQLVCILADDSGSMAGEKARAATDGIREAIMECQSSGPSGPERSYFRLLLIRFDSTAEIDSNCDMTPVRQIDPDSIEITGSGSQTNITGALQLLLERLRPYLQGLAEHKERAEHPLPLVFLFSDGQHNVGEQPLGVAGEIKQLALDGEPIVIASAGVSVGADRPDEKTLSEIASPGCYATIKDVQLLTRLIAAVASSGASRAQDVAEIMKNIQE